MAIAASRGMNHTSPAEDLTTQVHRALVVLDRVRLGDSGPVLKCNAPEDALEVFDMFRLPFSFAPGALEPAKRAVEALLWPSTLERAGASSNNCEELREKLSVVYLVLSSNTKRGELTRLAQQALEDRIRGNTSPKNGAHTSATAVSLRLSDERMPPVERLDEKIRIARKEHEAARQDISKSERRPEKECSANSRETKQKKLERSTNTKNDLTASKEKPHRPRAGFLRRASRTSVTSAIILLGGVGAFQGFETQIGSLLISGPSVEAQLNRISPVTQALEPLSDGAFQAFNGVKSRVGSLLERASAVQDRKGARTQDGQSGGIKARGALPDGAGGTP